jgi:hypothetical protein
MKDDPNGYQARMLFTYNAGPANTIDDCISCHFHGALKVMDRSVRILAALARPKRSQCLAAGTCRDTGESLNGEEPPKADDCLCRLAQDIACALYQAQEQLETVTDKADRLALKVYGDSHPGGSARRNNMTANCPAGRYLAVIESQGFSESQVKRTLTFSLSIRVIKSLDGADALSSPRQAEVIWWITDNNLRWVMEDIQTLGYRGKLAGIDPDEPNFHDFRGLQITVTCSHEESADGRMWERWKLCKGQQVLKDKAQLRRLDRLLTRDPDKDPEDGGSGQSGGNLPF